MDYSNNTSSDESFDDIDSMINKMNLNDSSRNQKLNTLNDNIHRINNFLNNPVTPVMTLELEILIKELHYNNDIYIQQISFNPEVYCAPNCQLTPFNEEQLQSIKLTGELLEKCIHKTLVIIYTPVISWNIQNVYEILYLSKQIYTLISQFI